MVYPSDPARYNALLEENQKARHSLTPWPLHRPVSLPGTLCHLVNSFSPQFGCHFLQKVFSPEKPLDAIACQALLAQVHTLYLNPITPR